MKKMLIKKIISSVLAVSALPIFSGTAEESISVRTEGIYALYQTVRAVVDGAGSVDEYTWLYSDSENGSYNVVADTRSEVPGEINLYQDGTEENLTVTVEPIKGTTAQTDVFRLLGEMKNSLAGKWLKCKVTVDGEEYESTPVQIDARIGSGAQIFSEGNRNVLTNANKTTPEKYKFTVEGQDFILLDVTDSPEKRYLVLADQAYGERVYHYRASYKGQNAYEMAYWLDNYFLNDGNGGKTFPEALKPYLEENYWTMELGRWWYQDNYYQGAVRSKLMVPSQTELKKYADKIGFTSVGGDWWTRTPTYWDTNDGNGMISVCGSDDKVGQTQVSHAMDHSKLIRPIFYLDEAFFEDGNIPLADMGTEVRKVLFERYSDSELAGMGYTDVLECREAEVSNPSISGTVKALNEVSAVFDGDDKYVDIEWQYSDTETGTYKYMASGKTLEIEDTYVNKYLRFQVYYGENKSIASEPQKVADLWDESFEGTVKSIKLKGIYETYQTVKAAYEFDEITHEDDIVYKKWYISSSEKSGYTEISGATGNELEILYSYANKYIKYEITLKNKKIYETEPRKIGAAWDYHAPYLTQSGGSNPLDVINATTPPEYVFEENGEKFILLDAFESDSSAFLVMTVDTFGGRNFDATPPSQPFTDMIEWLNSAFINSGNSGRELPANIKNYIDKDQVWKTEMLLYNTTREEYYYGGIAIPSVTELKKYSAKIGLQDTNMDWWTRTPVPSGDGNAIQGVSTDPARLGETYSINGYEGIKAAVRPIFYISRDYFLENKLDPETTGAEVYKTLAKVYTRDEMRTLYDRKTLEEKFGYAPDMEIKMYDEDINASENSIHIFITNHIDTVEGVVLVAIYGEDNKLLAVNSREATFTKDKEIEVSIAFSGMQTGSARRAEAYIIKSTEGLLKPLARAKKDFD